MAALVVLSLACGDALRQDVLDCEDAVAHLAACCPGFVNSTISCVYDHEGCSSQDPQLTLDESQCISRASCADLVASDVCGRAQQLPAGEPRAVCP